MSITDKLWERAKQLIPGGTGLFSKRPDLYAPGAWPAYYKAAKGADIWDLDDRHYVDFSMGGIGACALGYADPDVNAAVIRAVSRGSASSLNCPEDVELAEMMVGIHPWAQKVRYARTGGEAMAVAIRIARASTGRERVLACGYHGWHDWYMAGGGHLKGLTQKGVPAALSDTVSLFPFNSRPSLPYLTDVAAIVVEPVRYTEPALGWLEWLRDSCTVHGAILIFDEISSGFRSCVGGAHLTYGVNPDMAVFAKAISNGYPMGVVIGTGSVMDAAEETFISSTSWTERTGPTAAIATIAKMERKNVPVRLAEVGLEIMEILYCHSTKYGVPITITGQPSMMHIEFMDLSIATQYTRLMLSQGVLAGRNFYPMYAHDRGHIRKFYKAADHAFQTLAKGMTLPADLVAREGFQRLT